MVAGSPSRDRRFVSALARLVGGQRMSCARGTVLGWLVTSVIGYIGIGNWQPRKTQS